MVAGSVPSIPGTLADDDLASHFRDEVAQLLKRTTLKFPGAQPVSFAKRHLDDLQGEDYFVCEKSDGVRCLLYFTAAEDGKEIHYLIDRRNDYYFIPGLHFPIPGDASHERFHTGTIVDGELVNDHLPDGRVQLNFLVFDCLVLDNNSLMHRSLDKRLGYFREKVYMPWKALYEQYPAELEYLPFQVSFKNMEFSYAIEKMFDEVLPNLPHGNDGLIFTCRNSPYKFGTDDHILKWKPPAENSIDFRLALDFPARDPDSDEAADPGLAAPGAKVPDWDALPTFHLCVLHDRGRHERFATMHVPPEEWARLKALAIPLNDRVVECAQDARGRWRFMRFRDDKKDANHISTVASVMESITDRVEKEDLVAAALRIRDAWKRRAASAKGGR